MIGNKEGKRMSKFRGVASSGSLHRDGVSFTDKKMHRCNTIEGYKYRSTAVLITWDYSDSERFVQVQF